MASAAEIRPYRFGTGGFCVDITLSGTGGKVYNLGGARFVFEELRACWAEIRLGMYWGGGAMLEIAPGTSIRIHLGRYATELEAEAALARAILKAVYAKECAGEPVWNVLLEKLTLPASFVVTEAFEAELRAGAQTNGEYDSEAGWKSFRLFCEHERGGGVQAYGGAVDRHGVSKRAFTYSDGVPRYVAQVSIDAPPGEKSGKKRRQFVILTLKETDLYFKDCLAAAFDLHTYALRGSAGGKLNGKGQMNFPPEHYATCEYVPDALRARLVRLANGERLGGDVALAASFEPAGKTRVEGADRLQFERACSAAAVEARAARARAGAAALVVDEAGDGAGGSGA